MGKIPASRSTKVVVVASCLALCDGGEHDWRKRLPARPEIRFVCGQAISGSRSTQPQRAMRPLINLSTLLQATAYEGQPAAHGRSDAF